MAITPRTAEEASKFILESVEEWKNTSQDKKIISLSNWAEKWRSKRETDPFKKMIEIKNGKRRVVEKRIFQGYVLVQMKLSEDAWYIVRNTPSVTGFVGSGSDPTPIEEEEIEKIQKRMGLEQPKHKIDFNIGEVVNIIDGPFKGFDGSINEIDASKGKLKVLVNMFGRETPVELDGLQVKRV